MRSALRLAEVLKRPRTPVAISAGTRAEANTSQTIYTFSSVALPAPNAKGYLLIDLCVRSANALTVQSVTVDWGAGALPAVPVIAKTTSTIHCGLYMVMTPHAAGATATVVVTLALAATRCAIFPHQVATLSPTAVDTHFNAASAPTHTVTVPIGGAAIVAAACANGVSCTPSNYTEDSDAVVAGSSTLFTVGSDTTHVGSTTYTTTFSSGGSDIAGVAAVWGP